MKHFFKIFIVFFVIFSMIFGTSLYLIVAKENKQLAEIPMPGDTETTVAQEGEVVNVLLLGVDSLDGGKKGIRTDTMMILSMDPKNDKTSILSIPRDSRVKIRGRKGYDKINAAHAYGGVELSVQAVKDLLGIPIHHYVKVDYQALYKTVDEVGGVEVDIPMNMNYDDRYATPPLHIHFKKGKQVLDGQEAMEFLRFRKNNGGKTGYPRGDLQRVEVQQAFIQSLAKKVLSPSSIFNIKGYIDTFNTYVDTDMSVSEMASLGMQAKKMDVNNIRKETLPGAPMYINSISYYNPDNDEINKLVNELYYDNNNQTNVDLKIAVLNGSGISGVATEVADKLARQGLKPNTVGNADEFNNPKTIIYYDSKKEEAQKIRQIIGKGELRKDKSKIENKNTDIIVLIGKDI
ncbi:LCP family protein [Tepidibacter sp. Z1-5]|uniref:LCP family protein n=1 Tax=Tepidibacter sp. Z1-5 TaxID=3134138 RepID=UPI0030C07E21